SGLYATARMVISPKQNGTELRRLGIAPKAPKPPGRPGGRNSYFSSGIVSARAISAAAPAHGCESGGGEYWSAWFWNCTKNGGAGNTQRIGSGHAVRLRCAAIGIEAVHDKKIGS